MTKEERKMIDCYIVDNIIEQCKKRDISINKLAQLSDITQSTLNSILNHESKNPTILTIIKICNGLNISLCEFFDI